MNGEFLTTILALQVLPFRTKVSSQRQFCFNTTREPEYVGTTGAPSGKGQRNGPTAEAVTAGAGTGEGVARGIAFMQRQENRELFRIKM